MYDPPYMQMTGWDPKRVTMLSLSALYTCQVEGVCSELSEDLDAFIQVVQLCVEKYWNHEGPEDEEIRVTEAEVRQRFGMSDLMLRKIFQLIQAAGLTNGSGYDGDSRDGPRNWYFAISPEIRNYRKVSTTGEYLQTRQKVRDKFRAPPANANVLPPYLFGASDVGSIPTVPAVDLLAGLQVPPAGSSQETPSGSLTSSPDEQRRRDKEYEFDVAISFAGPQRDLAERLAKAMKDAGFSVFYDNYYADHLWGKDLPTFFEDIYKNKSMYCVIFVSREYVERMWTTWERRSATTRMLEERGNEYILPINVEQVDVPGIPTTIGYVSLDQHSIEEIAEMLAKKLRRRKTSGTEDDFS